MASQMSAPLLEYGTEMSARRRWVRRGIRLAAVILGGGGAIFYGPRVMRHWERLKVQARCMEAELPADRPMVEWNETIVSQLLANRRGEYSAGWWTSAVRTDPRWQDYSARLGIGSSSVETNGTLFMHERRTPSGERRLV